MSKTVFQQVKEFHEAFGHPVVQAPAVPPVDRSKLRLNIIIEEVKELVEAHVAGAHATNLNRVVDMLNHSHKLINAALDHEFNVDLVATADALGDINYVVAGAGHEYGIQLDVVGDEIHASNMTKLGEDGEPIYNEDGKVMKGPNYRKPDIAGVLDLMSEAYEEAMTGGESEPESEAGEDEAA